MRDLLAGVLAAALSGGFALAQEAPTPAPANASSDAVSTASAKDTDALIQEWLKGPSASVDTSRGPAAEEPLRDKAIHGEVGFSVGNHGYREAYGVANIPLGEHADATVAVDTAQAHYHGRDYNSRTFGLNLAFGPHAGAPREGLDCAALKSGRYVEPLWVTEMRRQQPGGLAADCPGS